MKLYNEIDPDETPVVVLGCGHFFTAETLDGHVGMGEVYEIDGHGEFGGLKDTAELARAVPRCPDCQSPVRQHATHRYNRVINRAVIDEMSKRFLVSKGHELQALEQQIVELERNLDMTCKDIINAIRRGSERLLFGFTRSTTVDVNKELQTRYEKARGLQKAIQSFCINIADSQQPSTKLYNATVNAIRRRSITELMNDLDVIDEVPALPRDRRIAARGQSALIKADSIILTDKFNLVQASKSLASNDAIKIPGGNLTQLAGLFFETCKTFITDSIDANLWRLSVEGILHYAKIARLYKSHCHSLTTNIENASEHINLAKGLLQIAKDACAHGFSGADILLHAVEESIKLLGKEWYEEVTAEELAAIKVAMVSGPNGIATHSGHWYNCANGHPVSLFPSLDGSHLT
jgi:hypothetical protein